MGRPTSQGSTGIRSGAEATISVEGRTRSEQLARLPGMREQHAPYCLGGHGM